MAGNGRQQRSTAAHTRRKRATEGRCDGCGESMHGDHTVCSPCLSVFAREHDAALEGGSSDALAAHYRLVNLYTVCCARARTRAAYRPLADEIARTLAGEAPALAKKLAIKARSSSR